MKWAKKYQLKKYFILSSNCRVTKGANRSLIQDFTRENANFISNEYCELIEFIDRKRLINIVAQIDDDSQEYFMNFLDFMISSEYGLLVDDLALFPPKSDALNEDHVILKDCIIEIEEKNFVENKFENNCKELDELSCEDIQLWFLDKISRKNLDRVLTIINNYNFLCIELCFNYFDNFKEDFYLNIIRSYPCISKIFLFNYNGDSYIFEFKSVHEHEFSMILGHLVYVNHPLSSDKCGIINFDNLTFGIEHQFEINKHFNGCLFKKLVIDVNGRLRNCPYIPPSKSKTIKEAISDPKFQKLWFIKKDDIEVCKDCEFRHNCTDCRAFVVDKNNIYSKPSKCNYNPYTNEWE